MRPRPSITPITLVILSALMFGCAVQRSPDGAFVADLGRDAGVVMTRGSDGSLSIVLDQNESKSFGKAMLAAITKWGFDFGEAVAVQDTAQQANAANALTAQQANAAAAATEQLSITEETARQIATLNAP